MWVRLPPGAPALLAPAVLLVVAAAARGILPPAVTAVVVAVLLLQAPGFLVWRLLDGPGTRDWLGAPAVWFVGSLVVMAPATMAMLWFAAPVTAVLVYAVVALVVLGAAAARRPAVVLTVPRHAWWVGLIAVTAVAVAFGTREHDYIPHIAMIDTIAETGRFPTINPFLAGDLPLAPRWRIAGWTATLGVLAALSGMGGWTVMTVLIPPAVFLLGASATYLLACRLTDDEVFAAVTTVAAAIVIPVLFYLPYWFGSARLWLHAGAEDKVVALLIVAPVAVVVALGVLERGRRQWIVLAAVFVALLLVHPLIFLFTVALIALYPLAEAVLGRTRATPRVAGLVLAAVPAAALGLGLEWTSVPFGVSLTSAPSMDVIAAPLSVGPLSLWEPMDNATMAALIEWDREGIDAATYFVSQKLALGDEQRYLALSARTVLPHPAVLRTAPFAAGMVGAVVLVLLSATARLRAFVAASAALVAALFFLPPAAYLAGRVATPWLLWRVVWFIPIPLVLAWSIRRLWRRRSVPAGLVALGLLAALASTFHTVPWARSDPFAAMPVAQALGDQQGVLVAPFGIAQLVSMRRTGLEPVAYRGATFMANNYPTHRLEEARQRLFDSTLFFSPDVETDRRQETMDRHGVTHVVVHGDNAPGLDLGALSLELVEVLPQGYELYRVPPP